MITAGESNERATSNSRNDLIAIDDGGLRLVEVNGEGKETGITLEVGGLPETEQDDGDICQACGKPMTIDDTGSSFHLDGDGGVDYDADADHTALKEEE